ncbi:adenylate/guanylate cyclase domain-containing protein, partial [Streptomyces sp. NPDC059810]
PAAAARALRATGLLRSALLDACRIRLDLGDWRTAHGTLAALEPTAGQSEAARPRAESADLDGLRARIAAVRGEAATATRLADRALATAVRTDSPIVQGLAALDAARTALALGHTKDAEEAAVRARWSFAAKGHLPAAREAEAVVLRCQGHRTDGTASVGAAADGTGKDAQR